MGSGHLPYGHHYTDIVIADGGLHQHKLHISAYLIEPICTETVASSQKILKMIVTGYIGSVCFGTIIERDHFFISRMGKSQNVHSPYPFGLRFDAIIILIILMHSIMMLVP